MQAVMAFAGKAATSMAGKAAASGAGQAASSGKALGGMSRGLSILGSISEYAGARQRAAAVDQEARDEEMARRQEFIVAAEKVNAIDADFNRLMGDQLVATGAMGIDAGSGSVMAARENAQSDADRERRIIRTNAESQAAQRRVRALALREGAKNARFGSTLKMGLDVAAAFA